MKAPNFKILARWNKSLKNSVTIYLVQMFLASRRQCLVWLCVWKAGLVPRMFEKGMEEMMKTRVGGRARFLIVPLRVEI